MYGVGWLKEYFDNVKIKVPTEKEEEEMIFADKLIKLRKQAGLSQEQLAEKLDVTRQAISKWEGSISSPDIPNVLKMCELFGVTADYLLQDSIEEMPVVQAVIFDNNNSSDNTDNLSENKGKDFAYGVIKSNKKSTLLCTLSLGIFFLVVGIIWYATVFNSFSKIMRLQNIIAAACVSIVLLVAFAVICVYDFIRQNKPVKSPFVLDEEATAAVEDYAKKYSLTGKVLIAVGIVLLILSPLPYSLSGIRLSSTSDFCYFLGMVMFIAALELLSVAIKIKMPVKALLTKRVRDNADKNARIFLALTCTVWIFIIALYTVFFAALEGWNGFLWILIIGAAVSVAVCIILYYLFFTTVQKRNNEK